MISTAHSQNGQIGEATEMGRRRIAVLMASIDREYQRDFVKGVFDAASKMNIDVCVFNCQGYMNVDVSTSDQGESAIFDLPRVHEFDGVISLRATFADKVTLRKVEEILRLFAGKPHVSIDVPASGAVSIQFDDEISVRQLTEHLVRHHGVRRVTYLSGPLHQKVAVNRLRACRTALETFGLQLRQEDIFEGKWIQESGRKCAEQLLSREEGLPDAVICGNDDMAFGLSEYMHERGYHIPEHLLVTGFDALREAVTRGLTTIRRPIQDAAREAVRVLAEWADGKQPEKWEIILPTVPVYGVSCGCEPEKAPARPVMRGMRNEHRRTEGILLTISMFNGSLSSAVDEQDAHGKIDQLVRKLGIREFYLCVNPALTRDVEPARRELAYPEEMLMLYGRKGETVYPACLFRTEDLVPTGPQGSDTPQKLIFCPLYYREMNFGYVAMELGPAAELPLYALLMMLNGTLISLYLQNSLRRHARRVEEMSVTDIMTGMLNRRGFMDRAPKMLETARKDGNWFVMLSADMDYMKRINDAYGHAAGDQAICRMGRAMEKLAKYGMIPVHISGDEFLAYGTVDSREKADQILEATGEAIREVNREDPWITEIGGSFGMYAAVPGEGETLDDYLTRADRAMYEQKRKKKEKSI